MVTRTKKALLAGAAVVAVVGAGSGIAYAQTSTPTTPGDAASAPVKPAKTGGHHHRGLAGRVEHGEFTTHTKAGEQVIDVQRGTVTAVNAQSISVKSTDGFTATYVVGPQVKVRKAKQPATISQVAVNDRVVIFADKNGTTSTAKRIGDAGPTK